MAVDGEGAGELPEDATNLAVRAYGLLADPSGKRFAFTNRIPLERGLGSSAAAIALGLAAARPDGTPEELLAAGLELESHADNLAAALAGGVTLTWEGRIARIADTLPLEPVALVPRERTQTEASRRSLPASVPHADAAANAARAALLAAGAAARRCRALRRGSRRPAARAVPRLGDPRGDPRRAARPARAGRRSPARGPPSSSGPTTLPCAPRRSARASRSTTVVPLTSPRRARCERPPRRLSPARGVRRRPRAGSRPPRSRERPLDADRRSVGRRAPPASRSRTRSPRSSRAPGSGRRPSCSPTTTEPAGRRAAGGFSATSATTQAGTFDVRALRRPARRPTSRDTSGRRSSPRVRDDDTIDDGRDPRAARRPVARARRRARAGTLARRRRAARPGRGPDPRRARTRTSRSRSRTGLLDAPSSSSTAAPA